MTPVFLNLLFKHEHDMNTDVLGLQAEIALMNFIHLLVVHLVVHLACCTYVQNVAVGIQRRNPIRSIHKSDERTQFFLSKLNLFSFLHFDSS